MHTCRGFAIQCFSSLKTSSHTSHHDILHENNTCMEHRWCKYLWCFCYDTSPLQTCISFSVSLTDDGSVSTLLMFDTCETRQCTNITIVNILIEESIESFFVTLERTTDLDPRITLDPAVGEIFITANDGLLYIPSFYWNLFRYQVSRLYWYHGYVSSTTRRSRTMSIAFSYNLEQKCKIFATQLSSFERFCGIKIIIT